MGVRVKTIKKAQNGEVMMEVLGGNDKAEALKQAIVAKNDHRNVTIKNSDDIVYITDIDGDVQKEEL